MRNTDTETERKSEGDKATPFFKCMAFQTSTSVATKYTTTWGARDTPVVAFSP